MPRRLVVPYGVIALLATVWLSQLVDEYLQPVESIRASAIASASRVVEDVELRRPPGSAALRGVSGLCSCQLSALNLFRHPGGGLSIRSLRPAARCSSRHLIATDLPTMVAWYGTIWPCSCRRMIWSSSADRRQSRPRRSLSVAQSHGAECDEERLEFWKRTLMSGMTRHLHVCEGLKRPERFGCAACLHRLRRTRSRDLAMKGHRMPAADEPLSLVARSEQAQERTQPLPCPAC